MAKKMKFLKSLSRREKEELDRLLSVPGPEEDDDDDDAVDYIRDRQSGRARGFIDVMMGRTPVDDEEAVDDYRDLLLGSNRKKKPVPVPIQYMNGAAEILDQCDIDTLPDEWQNMLGHICQYLKNGVPLPDIGAKEDSDKDSSAPIITIRKHDLSMRVFIDDGWVSTPVSVNLSQSAVFQKGAVASLSEVEYTSIVVMLQAAIFFHKFPAASFTEEQFAKTFCGIRSLDLSKFRFFKTKVGGTDDVIIHGYIIDGFADELYNILEHYDFNDRESTIQFLRAAYEACSMGNSAFFYDDQDDIDIVVDDRLNHDDFRRIVLGDEGTEMIGRGEAAPNPMEALSVADIQKVYTTLNTALDSILAYESDDEDTDFSVPDDDDEDDTDSDDVAETDLLPADESDDDMIVYPIYRQGL